MICPPMAVTPNTCTILIRLIPMTCHNHSGVMKTLERDLVAQKDDMSSDGGNSEHLHNIDSPDPDDLSQSFRSDEDDEERTSTPIFSLMEAVISTGGSIDANCSRLSNPERLLADVDDEHDHERYMWSLADADIEQLLQANKAACPTRSAHAPSAALGADHSSVEEDALLELLEEEVTRSLHFATPSP